VTSRHFQEGQCSSLVQGYVKDISSFAKRDFHFFSFLFFFFWYKQVCWASFGKCFFAFRFWKWLNAIFK